MIETSYSRPLGAAYASNIRRLMNIILLYTCTMRECNPLICGSKWIEMISIITHPQKHLHLQLLWQFCFHLFLFVEFSSRSFVHCYILNICFSVEFRSCYLRNTKCLKQFHIISPKRNAHSNDLLILICCFILISNLLSMIGSRALVLALRLGW